jgi:hypothetical protein
MAYTTLPTVYWDWDKNTNWPQTTPSKSTTATFPIATDPLSDKIFARDTRNDTRRAAHSCCARTPSTCTTSTQ